MSFENQVWEHKYRPKTIDDTVLPATVKKMLKEQLESGNLPNYLFCGPPGTGKTTCAYAISGFLDADVLFINASLDGNIDTLRTKITQFVSTVSFTDSKKIVVLDEADYLNPTSVMPALRGFLDEFSSNALFIFTCNFPERIISPLQSRLTRIDFKFSKDEKQTAMAQMFKSACKVLDSEGVTYDKKSVAGLVSKNFPDFRKTIVELQRYSSSGTIDSGILATIDDTGINELAGFLKEKSFTKVRQWIANNQMDSSQFYRLFYDKIAGLLIPQSIPQLILLIGESQFKASHSIDQEINNAAFCIQVMRDCQFQ
jgi:DNA polymerase III delta prime subunit